MNGATFNHLHTLRMENDEAKFRMEDNAPRFDRMRDRHTNGTAPRAVSAFNLFQTPHEIAADLARKLKIKHGENGLEPSCGLGRLIDYAMQYNPGHIVAVEMAPNIAGEIFRRNPRNVSLVQKDCRWTVDNRETGCKFYEKSISN